VIPPLDPRPPPEALADVWARHPDWYARYRMADDFAQLEQAARHAAVDVSNALSTVGPQGAEGDWSVVAGAVQEWAQAQQNLYNAIIRHLH
jgi:hypothetical protein